MMLNLGIVWWMFGCVLGQAAIAAFAAALDDDGTGMPQAPEIDQVRGHNTPDTSPSAPLLS
jgi:hypothetical protein